MLIHGIFLAVCALAQGPAVVETIDVARVWAGHPVGFALLTHKGKQFVAYYDADRDMRVAWRKLDNAHWNFTTLPEKVVWDSHNYITMAVDPADYLHLSGNMHCVPLVYFRTREPLAPDTFDRAPMVGELEQRVTYPRFIEGPKHSFVFTYRDGRSGNGDQIFNTYDVKTKTWRRLLDRPLTSGKGKMNAYFDGPHRGPDGRFHVCWVWRDTPDCATNHDPCYARSKDLVHWETSDGKPLALPITIDKAEIVDPIPPGGGIINGNVRLGFDAKKRAIVSYIKYDADGNTQAFNARFEDGAWKSRQASDWNYRWAFGGGGAIPFEVNVSGVHPHKKGQLKQTYHHIKQGSGAWILDAETLEPLGNLEEPPAIPPALGKPSGSFPGLKVRFAGDLGACDEPSARYVLRWETLDANRDRPRDGELPPPSMLQVIKLDGGDRSDRSD
ncbi:MAG TPA: BNR repeat-containing protein [Candidatus Hydrogenedentes bacterium]|nr:BNR repeat-containing protein [Candidatus Hydrogenedentota bacterium]HPC16234.1 BNR repeat-containing protein [Candidatus Hydrogenedentota bacterium]HRT18554.1 BNR repeat-containing protein [Candidatus Hydrogenedentota bacterium]HRT63573.1 BNR repeat-containing protein [Candidatus Hydrogenedentota bacterium]